MIKLKNKVGSAKLKELIVKDKKSKMVPVDNPYGSRPDVHYSDYMDRRRPVYREDYLPRRMTYQGRRTGRDYIPIHTSHGPGLYRNHSMVHGDSLRVREYDRVYIHHRPAFDWYNNNRYDLIDDVEEVLLPYEYDPLQTYARRTRRMSRCRSATPEIIVVKKVNLFAAFCQGVGILEISHINQGGYRFLDPIYFLYGGLISVFFNILIFRLGFYFSDTNFFQLNYLYFYLVTKSMII